VPAVFESGLNVPKFPPVSVLGPDQVPVLAGVPTSELNRLIEEPEAHKFNDPFDPALGAVFTVIVTVEETATHGPAPSGSFVVSVSTTEPVVIVGVYELVNEFAFENVPEGAVHVPVVAPPPTVPARVILVPEHIV
jgi:hypothetical protein